MSAAAGLAFPQILQTGRALEHLVCAFEMTIVETHKVALRVTHQPVSPVYVQDASIGGNVGGFFHLNSFYQERLDRSVQHECLHLRALWTPTH
jgi:hypothetical protein